MLILFKVWFWKLPFVIPCLFIMTVGLDDIRKFCGILLGIIPAYG